MSATPEALAAWLAEREALWARVREKLRPVPRPAHPAPEAPCRLAEAREMGRDALRLQRAAEGAGWRVQVTYARGWGVHSVTGRPTALRESVAVRCWGPDRRRVVACWTRPARGGGWSCDLVLAWSPTVPLAMPREGKMDFAMGQIGGIVRTAS